MSKTLRNCEKPIICVANLLVTLFTLNTLVQASSASSVPLIYVTVKAALWVRTVLIRQKNYFSVLILPRFAHTFWLGLFFTMLNLAKHVISCTEIKLVSAFSSESSSEQAKFLWKNNY